MTHVRKQIRDAVVAAVTGLTTTGTRVHPSHVYDVQAMPALAVYATEEEIEPHTMGRPITQARSLTIRIEGLAEGATSGPSDTLDQIALEVEEAMQVDRTFGGLVLDTDLVATEITFSGDGKKPAGAIRLEYLMLYRTAEDDPETSI